MKTNTRNKIGFNNNGIAMISILIAVAFLSIIGSALLYITYSNFLMKKQNLESKENFYETDGQLTQITTNIRNDVMKSSNDPKQELEKLVNVTFDSTTGVAHNKNDLSSSKYDVDNLVKYISNTNSTFQVTGNNDNKIVIGQIDKDSDPKKKDQFTYSGGNAHIVLVKDKDGHDVLPTNPVTYRLEDFTIEQESADGYVNTVRTDIDIQILKQSSSASSEGGVGSFSLLMDAPISTNSANFNILNLYGNCFLSNKEASTSVWSYDGVTYTPPGKAGSNKAAINIANEAKINFVGDYLIVYGDIVLNNKSSLYINTGQLTVYGDIYLNDSSTLICSGQVYQVKNTALPGRMQTCDVIIEGQRMSAMGANDPRIKKHIYPGNFAITPISEKNFQKFTETIALNDSDMTNDGVVNQIIAEYKGHKVTDSTIGKSVDQIEAQSEYTNFYGEQIGFAFTGKKNVNFNGKYKNQLVFNMGDASVEEGNVGCTFISKNQLKITQAHSITLTKVGSTRFDFLNIKSSEEGKNPNFDSKVHKSKQFGDFGNDFKDGFSAGDFLIPNPNAVVNTILGCGNGSDGEGGGDAKDSYISSISFVRYTKDFN